MLRIPRTIASIAMASWIAYATGCVYKPVPVVVIDDSTGAPIADARIGSDAVHWFSLLPDPWEPELTDAAGSAQLALTSKRTLVAVIRNGYEPMTFAVVPGGSLPRELPALEVEGGTPVSRAEVNSEVIDFDALSTKAQLLIPMTLCRREPIDVLVVNESGAPITGAEVLGSSFLYLPALGLEPEFGRLPLEVTTTDASGHAQVHWTSGFENRVCVRVPGKQGRRLRVGDPTREGAPTVTEVHLDPLVTRRVRFRVVELFPKGTRSRADAKPVEGATLKAGESRDGLPADPNGFELTTDAQGYTQEVLLPGPAPLSITVECKGFGGARLSPTASTYDDGDTIEVWLPRGKAGLGRLIGGVSRVTGSGGGARGGGGGG
ncbi:MAG: hypothetical protein O2855_08785 [Planctomycetota bacterium]|nr:hypothetical protein [Planctomycetota bacterium]